MPNEIVSSITLPSGTNYTITDSNAIHQSDIIVCTQSEYDAMQTRTGLLYFIKEEASS